MSLSQNRHCTCLLQFKVGNSLLHLVCHLLHIVYTVVDDVIATYLFQASLKFVSCIINNNCVTLHVKTLPSAIITMSLYMSRHFPHQ